MGSLEEEVVTVSLAGMEEGEIIDHGEGDPDRIDFFWFQSKIPHGD